VHAEHVELPGLKKETVIDLKLAGNKEGELYRLLLTAQCNALHTAMPFLFERIDDETELLLPDNLLNSDSLMRKLVGEIEEEDWSEVEIIGWLYQFYISEKKDEVIGKVVASEDIPAATQLFTPNWIVKYLVQNTLGRQWLATYPQSALRQQMRYYIEPAEQTPEVQEQLKAITPTSLNPEELTLLDPACGSGHILVEAYDLFKAIYQERGYRAKDIPALILQKNLYGMEIDDRAAQLAAFALMMKARADDRRIFGSEAKPNILAFEDSQEMNANEIAYALNAPINKDDVPNEYLFEEIQEEKDGLFSKKALAEKGHVSQGDIAALLELFENAKTFGSLIQVPPKLAGKLPEIAKRLDDVITNGDLTHATAQVLKPMLAQALMLARQYDAVVANPPYMGIQYYSSLLALFVKSAYKDSKSDLYACFIERNIELVHPNGLIGMITIPNWMSLSSFEKLRRVILSNETIETLINNGRGVFGSDFGSCSFVLRRSCLSNYFGVFRGLSEKQGSVATNVELEERFFSVANQRGSSSEFFEIPGAQVAYWTSPTLRRVFIDFPKIGNRAKKGPTTGNNAKYIRKWWEISIRLMSLFGGKKWFPLSKGGAFRRWYGNMEEVLNYENDGLQMRVDSENGLNPGYSMKAKECFFKRGITWSSISISSFSARLVPAGFIPTDAGPIVVGDDVRLTLSALNSKPVWEQLKILSPAVNFSVGHISEVRIPVTANQLPIDELIELSKQDWDSFEISWDFEVLPALQLESGNLKRSQEHADAQCSLRLERMKELEEKNNRLFIDAYGLQDELSPEVPEDQITLYRPDRAEDIKRLLSYAIGCIMGRYSLDKPGLIYANSGNQGFDADHYKTFRADDDGIIPLLETDWGIRDDATNRFVEFIATAWPKEHLEENLNFIADSLGPNNGEQPRETIRRYLATAFYKHHLSMYKKRPIYWLFSSGKQRAFQCLVYLHRYHEGTLARMRTEYVIPLQGQIAARIEQLEGDKSKATSTSHRKKLQKEQDDLKKQQTELLTFEEKLKHAADQKISLDLDDGVKVNYAKFGDLLAESKAITGGKDDE
jgi:type II restriction/modification system DNA methylase subunit YeeA